MAKSSFFEFSNSMPSNQPKNYEFIQLLDRVRKGDPRSTETLMESYGHHINRTIRRHLNRKIRGQFDSADFSQAVWATFLRPQKTIPIFRDPSQLVAFLTQIAKHKVIDECRKRLRTERYNVGKEVSFADRIHGEKILPGKSPTASAILIAKETLHNILDKQSSGYRNILTLRAAGATFGEIATEIGMDERSVRRVIKRLESQAYQ
jgi:RNA polymerase sigma factor (sigma-70 family)